MIRPQPMQLNRMLPVPLALALAACAAPGGVAPATGGGHAGPAGQAPSTQAPAAASPLRKGEPGPITLIDRRGTAATLVTTPGKKLTMVASSAATGSSPMKFTVTPYAQPPRAYGLAAAAAAQPADMPFRAGFRRGDAWLGKAEPGRRLLQAAGPRAVGHEDKFWVNTGNSQATGDRQQTCVLRRVSANAYFYVDKDAKPISDVDLDKLVDEWESRIYPRLTRVFGTESKPGIDGEDRVFIVLSPAVDNWGKEKGLMGYFWARDAIPGNRALNSNQKEVLFMTDQLFDRPALTSYGTLAHEFQHMINFSQKAARLDYRVTEETWLDEGLSMYAMEVAGYGLPAGDYHIAKDLRGFQENPAEYTLTDWSSNPHGFAYGQAYLFVRYLVDRYGEGTIKEILASDHAGVPCIDGVLFERGATFSDHFRDWAIANFVSGTPIAEGTVYSYKALSLKGRFPSPTGAEDIVLRGFQSRPAPGADVTVSLKPWGTAYYTFEAPEPRSWSLSLAPDTAGRLLGATIVP